MSQSDQQIVVMPKRPIFYSLLILVSGILIGAGLMFIGMQRRLPKQPAPGPEYFSEHMVNQIVRELRLTPQQQEQLKPIVKKHFESMNKIRMEARPKISEELKQMNESIMSILDEPQKRMWVERVKRMREMFPQGFGPGRGPGQRLGGPEEMRPLDERRPPLGDERIRERYRLERRERPPMGPPAPQQGPQGTQEPQQPQELPPQQPMPPQPPLN